MNKVVGAVIVLIIIIGVGLAASHKSTNTNSSYTSTSQSTSQSSASTSQSPKPTGANEVSIINMSFSPASMTVKKGTSVKWINNDNLAHTVQENDGQAGPNSSTISPGATYSFTFNTSGVFHYHCSIHPDMLGTVTVTE